MLDREIGLAACDLDVQEIEDRLELAIAIRWDIDIHPDEVSVTGAIPL